MKYLLDANVLVALLDNKNVNHRAVIRWFSQQIIEAKNNWLSCAITQMACLRILCLPSYPADYSFGEVQQLFNKVIHTTHHQFLAQEINLVQQDVIDWRHLQGHRQLTQFVTFDNRINYRTVKNAAPEHLLILDI